MARRVAVACVLALAVAAERERADRVFRDIHGAESHRHPDSVLVDRQRRRRRDRRRRRSSATLGCGLCRPPRCSRTVSGRSAATGAARTTSRATPTSATSPARSRVGIRDRAEIFGSFLVDTRIDRDVRPIFVNDPTFGGFVDRYPAGQSGAGPATTSATSTSARRSTCCRNTGSSPAALAVRGMVKLPTGDEDVGRQHRQDGFPRRLHRQQGSRRSWSKCPATPATSGAGSPDGFDTPGGAFRWGAGVGFPSRNSLRGHRRVERRSCRPTIRRRSRHDAADRHRRQPSRRSSATPRTSRGRPSASRAQHRNGFFVGAGVSWNVPTQGRDLRVRRRRRGRRSATTTTGRSGSGITRACASTCRRRRRRRHRRRRRRRRRRRTP